MTTLEKPISLKSSDQLFDASVLEQQRGDILSDIALKRACVAMEPYLPQAHINLGLCLLRAGQFLEGWDGYAWLHHNPMANGQPNSTSHGLVLDEWDGVASLRGKVLIVACEEGLGDFVQFLRYLPLIAKRHPSVRIKLLAPAPLASLFRRHKLVHSVLQDGDLVSSDSYDCWKSTCQLPSVLGCTDLTPTKPYLYPDTDYAHYWERRLPKIPNTLRVAILWGGNPKHSNDSNRSLHFTDLLPLFDVSGVVFTSIQFDGRRHEARDYWGQENLTDAGSYIESFEDTAAILSCMDLLIAVDSAPMHVAGATGVRTWVMLPLVSDWRWGYEGTTTNLYPNMELFRQNTEKCWAHPVSLIKASLEKLATTAGE